MQVTPSFVWSNFYYPQISQLLSFEYGVKNSAYICEYIGTCNQWAGFPYHGHFRISNDTQNGPQPHLWISSKSLTLIWHIVYMNLYPISLCIWMLEMPKIQRENILKRRISGLTLKVLKFWKFTSYCSLKPLWSGMGEVVPARTSPTLHPPSPPTMHQLSRLAL